MRTQAFEHHEGAGSRPDRVVDSTRATAGRGRRGIPPAWWFAGCARPGLRVGALLVAATVGIGAVRAAEISVPNGSFESPATEFVDIRLDSWQKTPKPDWFDESGGQLWDQLTGLYLNLPAGDPGRIENCDGNQAVWIFAVPQAGFFQDYESTDWSSTSPLHAFDARYEAGKSYQLTVGVLGGGGNMQAGASLLVELYYRDGSSNQVSVAATTFVYAPPPVPGAKRFVDVTVEVPAVPAGAPWAGQHIGIRLLSTIDPSLAGGFWDVDNVRLDAFGEPVLLAPGFFDGKFGFTIQSAPGAKFEILAASDARLPLSNWTSLATLTSVTGSIAFKDESPTVDRRFYRARQVE